MLHTLQILDLLGRLLRDLLNEDLLDRHLRGLTHVFEILHLGRYGAVLHTYKIWTRWADSRAISSKTCWTGPS